MPNTGTALGACSAIAERLHAKHGCNGNGEHA
jgi:hypothetical protein